MNNGDKRAELDAAMCLLREHNIIVVREACGGHWQYRVHGSYFERWVLGHEILEQFYPILTPVQLKLEELEKQQRVIADQMEELRKSL